MHLVYLMLILVAMGVCWKTAMSPKTFRRKARQRTGSPLRKCAGNLPVMPLHFQALNDDSDLQLARTPISPEDISRKEVSADWFAFEEMCWKLTRDEIAAAKLRQRLAIGHDTDIA